MPEQFDPLYDDAFSADPMDAEKNKIVAIIAYLGLLVIVPIIAARESPFAMYHANQGLLLLILWVGVWFLSLIPVIGLLGIVGWIILIVFSILGIINAANGRMKPLPFIGHLQIIR